MTAAYSLTQAERSLATIRAAVEYLQQDRDYLVGGLQGLGVQQTADAIANVLELLLASLDYIETQLHGSLRIPLQEGKRSLRLADLATQTGDLEAVARDLEAARASFLRACARYEDHGFLRVLCLCAAGVTRSLQGDRYGMSCHFREAFSELEAFRFLKISAALSRLKAADRDGKFVAADLERQAAAKVDALAIPEWGVTLTELRATLQNVVATATTTPTDLDAAAANAEFGFDSSSVFGPL